MTPTIRYCGCGYPVRITGHWTGHDYVLVLTDGHYESRKASPELQLCPECHHRLDVAHLFEHAPIMREPSPSLGTTLAY
jgi:hypothetical protein